MLSLRLLPKWIYPRDLFASKFVLHACDDGGDVGLCYLSIIIKVIYVEDEFQLLVELRTVNTEEAGQELFWI